MVESTTYFDAQTEKDTGVESDLWTPKQEQVFRGVSVELKTILLKRFGHGSEDPMEHHNLSHSTEAGEFFVTIGEKLREIDPTLFDKAKIKKGYLYLLGHDIVQKYTPKKGPEGFVIRSRHRGMGKLSGHNGGNELASADEFIAVVQEQKGLETLGITADDVYAYFGATYPEFDFREGLRIYQPLITEDVPVSVMLMGLCDLSRVCGATSFDKNEEVSWSEFRELNIGLTSMLSKNPSSLGEFATDLDIEIKAKIARIILKWASSQPSFVEWQERQFNGFLDGYKHTYEDGATLFLPSNKELNSSFKVDELKDVLRSNFNKFDENAFKYKDKFTKMSKIALGPDLQRFDDAYGYVNNSSDSKFKHLLESQIDKNPKLMCDLLSCAGYNMN